jgi:protein-S-isoprenylcysteine O-methyltransferase Ste14
MNAYMVVVVTWGIFWAYWFVSGLLTSSRVKRGQSSTSTWLEWVLLTLGFWTLFSSPAIFGISSARFLPDSIAVNLIGIVILISGLIFTIQARIQLGQNWSGRVTIKVDHQLIQSGPYKIVRHPIYTGILFGFIGSVIVIGKLGSLLGFVPILADLIVKISKEEKFLLEEFGSNYIQYKKTVKALIPFIA